MLQNDNTQLNQDVTSDLRDVTSTARLFNFRRPVFMTAQVWDDCVELVSENTRAYDELAVLQRLRHVLFMASSTLHGRMEDLESDFRVYRVSNGAMHGQRQPEPIDLCLCAHKDEHNRPVITIRFPQD